MCGDTNLIYFLSNNMINCFIHFIHSILELLPISSSIFINQIRSGNMDQTISLHVYSGCVHIILFFILFKKYFRDLRLILCIPVMLFISLCTLICFNLIILQKISIEIYNLFPQYKIFTNLISAILLLFTIYKNKNKYKSNKIIDKKNINQIYETPFLNINTAILLGFLAIISLFFGTSRLGLFLTVLNLKKYNLKDSIIYSFILSNIYNIGFGLFRFKNMTININIKLFFGTYILVFIINFLVLKLIIKYPKILIYTICLRIILCIYFLS